MVLRVPPWRTQEVLTFVKLPEGPRIPSPRISCRAERKLAELQWESGRKSNSFFLRPDPQFVGRETWFSQRKPTKGGDSSCTYFHRASRLRFEKLALIKHWFKGSERPLMEQGCINNCRF